MNILYISHLSTNIAAGMNWSVPASVGAQEKIDDVLWVNTTDVVMPHWKNAKGYRNMKDLGGKLSLSVLPKPFDKPDVVIFEGIYFKEYIGFSKELGKSGVPYIVVPRGSLTYQALHNHAWLKKWFAHKLFFDSFIKNAWRIQYLTEQEAEDSSGKYKKAYFITPNGFYSPKETKDFFLKAGLYATFIGRLDLYHKGIDILFHAIADIHDELRQAGFTLNLFGPRRYDYYKIKEEIQNRGIGDIVHLHDEVGGNEKKKILLSSDLFIMTSRFEGHPMGLIEALAYGLPCLVTPGTNMAKEIKEANAGWVCEGNVDSIKNTILKAITDKDLYVIKSQHAKELARQYDWDKLAGDFHKELMKMNVI